ncbi:hypothetical protein, partial [Burkholderia multivorans]|uniref:hypothetical protein n=1 Tax=Burkholderia multivorans TaxID=87883 RepID=UPI001E595E78
TALPGTIQHWNLNLNPPHTRNSGYLLLARMSHHQYCKVLWWYAGGQPTAYTDRGGSFLFFSHTRSGFNVDYSPVSKPNQLAYVAAVHGPVTITSRSFTNSGRDRAVERRRHQRRGTERLH